MESLDISKSDNIATLTLRRGKVNALNEEFIGQIKAAFQELENDYDIKSVIITGGGNFFSFGFDIPEFLNFTKGDFGRFVTKFTELYTYLFMFPKPVIAALNGHTIAGGCMLASACDYRLMVPGRARISLNEVAFGSTVFAGSVEMLKCSVCHKNAEKILFTGKMFTAEEAFDMGLVDRISFENEIYGDALKVARGFAQRSGPAFASIKKLCRGPVAEKMKSREEESIREFLDIWYSDETQKNIRNIKIR